MSLIGVITTPRDMSVMLVLAYADNGSLLDYARTKGEEASTSIKLTFCAEIAQGMEYIASRRVVRSFPSSRTLYYCGRFSSVPWYLQFVIVFGVDSP